MVTPIQGQENRRAKGIDHEAWLTLVLGCAMIVAGCSDASRTQSPTGTPAITPMPVPTAPASPGATPTAPSSPPPSATPTPTEPMDGIGGPEDDNGFYPIVPPCDPYANYYTGAAPEWNVWILGSDPWSFDIRAEWVEGRGIGIVPMAPDPWWAQASDADKRAFYASTVTWSTRAGSATSADFVPASGTLSYADWANQRNGANATILADALAEPTESFFIDLVSSTGAAIGPCATVEIGIWDDDYLLVDEIPPVVEGSANSRTEVPITVRLAYPQPVPVDVSVGGEDTGPDGAAIAEFGSDWLLAADNTKTLLPGQMSAGFVIDIVGDDQDEPDEVFTIYAGQTGDERDNASGQCICVNSPSRLVTIIDDDPGGSSPGPTQQPPTASPSGIATATLAVVKEVINDDGGTLSEEDFALFIDGRLVYMGVPTAVTANTPHTVTEQAQPGYSGPEYGGACAAGGTVTLGPGESAVCTLRNNDKPPYLMLFKEVNNDDGGTAQPGDWTLFATAAPPNDLRNRAVPGSPGVFKKVYAGVVYTLSESNVPGYTAGAWKCDGEALPNVDKLTLEMGQYVTCIIENDDQPPRSTCIVGWGLNDLGQGCRPAIDEYRAIAAGGRHSLAVGADGTLVGWGDNTYGQRTVPAGNLYVEVAAGGRHSLALRSPLRSDGGIVGWGDNTYGQRTVPAGSFTAIAAGERHSLALRADGSIVGWGDNTYGQRTVPAGSFIAIAAGARHSLALRGDGSVVGWGDNTYGQRTSPTGNDFIAITAGGYHSLALRRDRSIVGWGDNTYGQRTPPAGGDFNAIAAGDRHSLALSLLCRQPDGLVRVGTGPYVGSDVYNSLATNQTAAGSKPRGKTQVFSIAIQNDGTMADRFRLAAAGTSTTMYTVTYWWGTTNISAAVLAGSYQTPLLDPGQQYVVKAKVKVNSTATVGSSVSRLVTLTSGASPATVDAVRFTVSRS